MDGARDQLERLWQAHLKQPFPSEWNRLVERFGEADERTEVQALRDADRLESSWGGPDLILYDTYVAGLMTQVLSSNSAGPEVIREVIGEGERDQRLDVFLDLCAAEANDDETREQIRVCRDYIERVNRMLDVARQVPSR